MITCSFLLFVYPELTYTFMDGLTWLFQIIMFLCLGLLVNPHEMMEVACVALLIGVFMILIGRPLSVFICLLPFGRRITFKSRLFISWVGLRGAVPIIFPTYPVVADKGYGSVENRKALSRMKLKSHIMHKARKNRKQIGRETVVNKAIAYNLHRTPGIIASNCIQ